MAAFQTSPTARVLIWLADAVYAHRRLFLYPQLVLAGLCVWFTAARLEFHTSRNDLVGGEKQYHRIFLEYKKEFPLQDDLVVVVEGEQIEKNRQFVERLGAKLDRETNFFNAVFYKGDLKRMGPKALLFLPEKDLADLRTMLQDYLPFLQQFSRTTNLVSLFDLINTQIRTAREEDNATNRALVKALPALERIVEQATDSLTRLGTPPSPGINTLFEGGKEAEQQMYLTYGHGRIFLITAQPRAEGLSGPAVERMRQLISGTQLEVPGLNVGLTGEPVLEYDEMAQSQIDSTLATVVSLIAVALIFIYGYHETGRPLKATGCLIVGLAYTMGYTTLVVGHLNILTITFVPILIGLAIDFGVHLITRYEEELWHGRSDRHALEKAMVFTGTGIFSGALTTAAAFFAMGFTGFKGIQEMGLICGGGMLVCLVPMMTLLPVLLLRGRQNVLDHELGPKLDRAAAIEETQRARIENIWLQHPWTTVAVVAGLSLLCIGPARRVKFDYNLLHMQSRGLPAVIFQDRLIEASSSDRSVLFGVIVASNLTQAAALTQRLTNLPTVASVDSVVPYLAEDQAGKLELLRAVTQIAAGIRFQPLDRRPANVIELSRSLWSTHGYLGQIAARVAQDDPELHRSVLSLREAISRLRHQMLLSDPAMIAGKLADFQQGLFSDVAETFAAIRQQDARGPMRLDDLPAVLRQRFVGVTGKLLLQVYPRKNVWDREAQKEFVADLRKVDPRSTGAPVQLLEYTTLLKESYQKAALYALGAIALMVFIHFRSVPCVILALLPVGIGSLWLIGMMGALGYSFNPANVMTLPLVVGIGVTNGIHILNRFAEERHPSILARSTGKAVLVSGLTTIAGFGSLVVAQHQGIQSLGYIMAIGTATCMVAALTFLASLLNLLTRVGWKRWKPHPEPVLPEAPELEEAKPSEPSR